MPPAAGNGAGNIWSSRTRSLLTPDARFLLHQGDDIIETLDLTL
jgi:hypothetical protein